MPDIPQWLIVDSVIVLAFALQHTVFTTKVAVDIFNKLFPPYLWNILFSIMSVVLVVVGLKYWQSSGVYLFHFVPGSMAYHLSLIVLAASLFFFFYFFKYTTSFWQWLGVKQVILKLQKKKLPAYYRVRKEGVKKYIRFPHHTCLIVFF